MAYLMGIDIGTSSLKTCIFREDGALAAVSARPYTPDVPRIGCSEQDPQVWWQAAVQTIAEALERSGLPGHSIDCIGFSGQMHGLVMLDKEGESVRPALLHNDVRSPEQVDKIKALFPGGAFSRITYNPVFSGFGAVNLLWVRDNEPEHYRRIRRVCCVKDYVRYRITGRWATEHTDASVTLLYDMEREEWSGEILEALGYPPSFFPEIHNSCEVAGAVGEETARLTGLAAGTPVVYGGADQAMHTLGNGVYRRGAVMANLGTGGQILTVSERPALNTAYNTHTCRHVEPGSWYSMAANLSAGSSLKWFQRTFAAGYTFAQLDELAAAVPPCSNGLCFFPCMMGERTPYVDPYTRGMFIGMTHAHGLGHFARALMEGVVYNMKSALDITEGLYGPAEKIICAGGGAKSAVWRQIQADVYGREIYLSNTQEQACVGAAIAAGVGAGVYGNIAEGCGAMVRINPHPVTAIAENTAAYTGFYEDIYRHLYEQNAGFFRAMARY